MLLFADCNYRSVYVIIVLYIKAMICNKLTERGSLCSYLLTVIIVVYMS